MDPYINLVKKTIKHYFANQQIIDPDSDLPKEMLEQKAGVFVSYHNQGELRGCIGTFSPTKENIAQEVIANAITAATEDNRFLPIEKSEIDQLDISVDVLSEPELVQGQNELDPKKYGVLVKSGYKSGLLLPDLQGVDSVEQQLDIACQKAGINYPEEKIEIYKFTVTRHGKK